MWKSDNPTTKLAAIAFRRIMSERFVVLCRYCAVDITDVSLNHAPGYTYILYKRRSKRWPRIIEWKLFNWLRKRIPSRDRGCKQFYYVLNTRNNVHVPAWVTRHPCGDGSATSSGITTLSAWHSACDLSFNGYFGIRFSPGVPFISLVESVRRVISKT